MLPSPRYWNTQKVDCNLCGIDDYEILFRQDQHGFGLRTVMCRRCGLIYLNPRPTAQEYDELYQRWYHQLYPARAAFNKGKLGGRIAAETARQRCRAYAQFLSEPIRLLEIGPGEGAFLSALQSEFPKSDLRGIDLSPLEVEACRSRGLHVVHGSIQSLPPTATANTHIVLFHVLEHTLDPLRMLQQAAARLGPEGYLFVEVPNILGSWEGLGMLHVAHAYQFAPATLSRVLHAAGLQLVHLESVEAPFFQSSIRAVARLGLGILKQIPVPVMPSVEEVRFLFQKKLKNWQKQLIAGRLKRFTSACLGPHWTAALWEHTAGREWERSLKQVETQV